MTNGCIYYNIILGIYNIRMQWMDGANMQTLELNSITFIGLAECISWYNYDNERNRVACHDGKL